MELNEQELVVLGRVTHYYERSMGVTRHLVRLTARGDVKDKFRFIVDESLWLERAVEQARGTISQSDSSTVTVTFTPRAIVALWGRLLSSVNTPRSRRKLRREDVRAREMLSEKLGLSLRALEDLDPALVRAEVATRRTREVEWMRAFLMAPRA